MNLFFCFITGLILSLIFVSWFLILVIPPFALLVTPILIVISVKAHHSKKNKAIKEEISYRDHVKLERRPVYTNERDRPKEIEV